MKRNIIAALALLSIASCTKKDSTSVSPSTLTMKEVGYTCEKTYHIYVKKVGPTSSMLNDSIIFHSDNTVTEYYGATPYTYHINIVKNGVYYNITVPDTSFKNDMFGFVAHNYTTVWGTYQSGISFDCPESATAHYQYSGTVY